MNQGKQASTQTDQASKPAKPVDTLKVRHPAATVSQPVKKAVISKKDFADFKRIELSGAKKLQPNQIKDLIASFERNTSIAEGLTEATYNEIWKKTFYRG